MILSHSERQCGHDGIPFPTRPTYTGRPWFLRAWAPTTRRGTRWTVYLAA